MDAPRDAARPVLYWDTDCGFCRAWINRWRETTGPLVDYQPLQSAPPAVVAAAGGVPFQRVVLASADGSLHCGAKAALGALAVSDRSARILLGLHRHVAPARFVMESGYRWVASHREFCAWMTRLLWGRNTLAPTYELSGWLFPRLVGLVFLFAFLSLWVQIDGLGGSRGILPVAAHLDAIHAHYAGQGSAAGAWWRVPSLLWLGASDGMLHVWLGVGTIAALLLIIGFYPALAALVAWACYLSFASALPVFLGYQWDALLLETGFLLVFFVPWRRWLRGATSAPPRLARLLVWWLLFRLMFESGVVKLYGFDAAGHNAWLSGTALTFHYFTQPIPVWTSWWFAALPDWFHRLSVGIVFFIELILPFFIWAPRRLRMTAFWGFTGLMVLILLSGNYGFFNLLTIALCITLIDDASWPARLRRAPATASPPGHADRVRRVMLPGIAAVLIIVTTVQLLLVLRILPPAWAVPVLQPVGAFRSANSYGLFSAMTTERPEITIEASPDGIHWEPYSFRWKIDADRPSMPFTLPHMPRLDWQMWFAALEMRATGQIPAWMVLFLERLHERSPPVLGLLDATAADGFQPQYFRLHLDLLEFTTPEARQRDGKFWQTTPLPHYTLEGRW